MKIRSPETPNLVLLLVLRLSLSYLFAHIYFRRLFISNLIFYFISTRIKNLPLVRYRSLLLSLNFTQNRHTTFALFYTISWNFYSIYTFSSLVLIPGKEHICAWCVLFVSVRVCTILPFRKFWIPSLLLSTRYSLFFAFLPSQFFFLLMSKLCFI